MESAAHFHALAARCRELAGFARDKMTARNLRALGEDYEAQARQIETEAKAEPPNPLPD